MDNYKIQANQAREIFLTYDQEALIQKHRLESDETWLYTSLFEIPYRIRRTDGTIRRKENGLWVDGGSFEETMTLLDLLCDSRKDRFVTGRLKNMADFGLMFHQRLLEKDPWAQRFQDRLPDFQRACEALGARPMKLGDVAYGFRIFEELTVVVQLWLGDEEFPPSLRFLWDENALMYLRYETMYFAKGLLLRHIQSRMNRAETPQTLRRG